jgi:hypothetical protein
LENSIKPTEVSVTVAFSCSFPQIKQISFPIEYRFSRILHQIIIVLHSSNTKHFPYFFQFL